MVQQKESVVTAERFSQGMTYKDYLGSIERNQKRFEENYAGTEIPADDVAKLKALMAKPGGPAKMVIIGEDWCPDVFRGMPVFARMSEATGMEMRVFKRDENKDMIGEFLNGGEHESIPVAVFYTKDMDYIAHFIERPALANEEMHDTAAADVRTHAEAGHDGRREGRGARGVHRLPERADLVELAPSRRCASASA